jgi:hypothetical protein
MTTFEVYLSIGSVVIAIVAWLYVWRLVQTSGRDRPHDPASVKRFIERAARLSAEQDDHRRDGSVRNTHSN